VAFKDFLHFQEEVKLVDGVVEQQGQHLEQVVEVAVNNLVEKELHQLVEMVEQE
jgi:hypothetical protein